MAKHVILDFFKTPEECDNYLAHLRQHQLVEVDGDVLRLYECSRIVQQDAYHVEFFNKQQVGSILLHAKKKYHHH